MELAIDFEVSTGIDIPPATRHLVEAGVLPRDAGARETHGKITTERVACAEAFVVGDEDMAPADTRQRKHTLQIARGKSHRDKYTLAPGAKWEPYAPVRAQPGTRPAGPPGGWAGAIVRCAVCGRCQNAEDWMKRTRFMFEQECVGRKDSYAECVRRAKLSQMAEKRKKAAAEAEEGTGGAPARPKVAVRRPLNARGNTIADATRRLASLLGRPVVPGELDSKKNEHTAPMRSLDGQTGHAGLQRRPILAGGEATERVLRQIVRDLRTPLQCRHERAEAQEHRTQQGDDRVKEQDDAYHGRWEPAYDEGDRKERARTFLARVPRLAGRVRPARDVTPDPEAAEGSRGEAPEPEATDGSRGEAPDPEAEGGSRGEAQDGSRESRGRGREESRETDPGDRRGRAQGRGPGHRGRSRGRGAPRTRMR